jgi:ribosomal protein S18 acetylase RimI-like enzyme
MQISTSKITIKKYHTKNMIDVLSLIDRSGHTVRSAESWIENNMSAVLAFDNDNLIGAIPFERFNVSLGDGVYTPALWVSAAYVDPEYRGLGVGTSIDQAINQYFYPKYQMVLVVRKDEGTSAFQWYQKIGYTTVSKIISLRLDIIHTAIHQNYQIIDACHSLEKVSDQLCNCFDKNNHSYIGYPERTQNFWCNKFKYHYYGESYIYSVLIRKNGKKIISYSLLGRTTMNDGVDRLDILEFVSPDDAYEQHAIYNSIMHYAQSIGVVELRIQTLEGDPLLQYAYDYGFTKRWETNLMARMLNPNTTLPQGKWRFFHVDYL